MFAAARSASLKANCTLAAIRLAALGCDVDYGGPRKTAKWLPGLLPGPTTTEHAYLISWTCCEYVIKGNGSGAMGCWCIGLLGEANCQVGS